MYVSYEIPSLMIGTVGGGTGLPTQKECLQMMGCYGRVSYLSYKVVINSHMVLYRAESIDWQRLLLDIA